MREAAAGGARAMLFVQHQPAAADRRAHRAQPVEEEDLLVDEPG